MTAADLTQRLSRTPAGTSARCHLRTTGPALAGPPGWRENATGTRRCRSAVHGAASTTYAGWRLGEAL